MNRYLIFIAASRIGRVHPIQNIAELADRYLSSQCTIRSRRFKPCLREYAPLGFQSLRIKTDASWRPMAVHPWLTCALAMENGNPFFERMSSRTWISQTSRCSLTLWLLG